MDHLKKGKGLPKLPNSFKKAQKNAADAEKKAAADANKHAKRAKAYGKKLGAKGLKVLGGVKGVIKSLGKGKMPQLPKSFAEKKKTPLTRIGISFSFVL